jgi:hypothetical protein
MGIVLQLIGVMDIEDYLVSFFIASQGFVGG